MTTDEMAERALSHLDHDRVRFPVDEVIDSGLTPAQDLIALYKGTLRHSLVVEVPQYSGYIDLLIVDPCIVSIERVVLGRQTADTVSPGPLGGYKALNMTDIESLAGVHPSWYTHIGMPTRYFLHGRNMLGLWPRPAEDIAITLQASCVPRPLSVNDTARESELIPAEHELVSDVAYALLLIKEGAVEVDKALQRLNALLEHEDFSKALRALRRRAREWPSVEPRKERD